MNASVSYILLSFMGGQVNFATDSIGDQHFLDMMSRDILKDPKELIIDTQENINYTYIA